MSNNNGNRFGRIVAKRRAREYYERQRNNMMERALQSPFGQLIINSIDPPSTETVCLHPFNDGVSRHQCVEGAGHNGDHICVCGAKCTPEQQAHSVN